MNFSVPNGILEIFVFGPSPNNVVLVVENIPTGKKRFSGIFPRTNSDVPTRIKIFVC